MKRVVMISQDFISVYRGGAGLQHLKMARALQSAGANVCLIAPAKEREIEGIAVRPVHRLVLGPLQLWHSLIFILQVFFYGFNAVRRADVVFPHNSVSGLAALPLARLLGKRTVYHVNDLSTEYRYAGARRKWEKMLFRVLVLFEHMTFRWADLLLVPTRVMRRYIAGTGVNADRILLAPDGALMDQFNGAKTPHDYLMVIHHGNLAECSGTMTLIEAAPQILAKYPATRFYILGQGEQEEVLKQRAAALGLGEAVVFTGWISYAEMCRMVVSSDIGVIPRTDILPNHAITTGKIMEYWASRTVVVASRLEGISEVAEDGTDAVLFRPGDPDDLAEKIIRLAGDAALRKRLADAGYEKVKRHYTIEEICRRVTGTVLGEAQ